MNKFILFFGGKNGMHLRKTTMAKPNPIVSNLSIPHPQNEKRPSKDDLFSLAERMGFEPMCPEPDNRISSAARYDHFDIFPK